MNELKEQGSKAYLISIVMVVLSDLLFPDSWPRTWDERNR